MGCDDLVGFSGSAPIFPLPNTVLFPHTLLPLHIFEPRYRDMTRDALGGERLIAMALLRPGWEADEDRPAVHDTVGLGRIVQERRLADGRYNILLYGLRRARILDETRGESPYRVARLEILAEPPCAGPEADRLRLGLLAVYSAIVKSTVQTAWKPDPDLGLGRLCDVLTASLDLGTEMKQRILGELDPIARARTLASTLQASSYARTPIPGALAKARVWPPDASKN